MMNTCPNCGSMEIAVGSFPLECFACGWSYLNVHECGVCGGPAAASMSVNGTTLFACRKHPFTDAETMQMLRRFSRSLFGEGI